jgi:cytochrome c-type biogenesis protein CcmE
VEKLVAAGVDELRGVVSGLTGTLPNAAAFSINGFAITTNGSTTLVPAGAVVVNGTLVEVNLAGSVAARITVEDAADVEFEPAEGQEFEVEGFVSLFTVSTATFKVNDQVVSLDSSVRYEGGLASDLGNGTKVEAEGHLAGGILVANKITFKENIKIKDFPTAVNATSNAVPDLVVLGLTVKATSTTLNTFGTISTSSRLEIRGFLNLDGTITSVRMKPGSGGDPFLQGVVTDVNAAAHTFKIAGIIVSAGTATARPNDDNGTDTLTMNRDSFFASLSAGKTVVKAKGTFSPGSPGTITATEVEIE